MSKRSLALIAILAMVAAIAVACGGGSGGGSGGTTGTKIQNDDKPLIILRALDPLNGDPHRSYCDTCMPVLDALYQSLVGVDHTTNGLIPKVAMSWTPSDDLTAWTFELNPKAVFSDGTPLTSEDVKWSLERLANLKSTPSFFVEGVTSVDAPSPTTVVVHLAAPDASIPAKLSAPFTGIVNKKVAEAHGATADADAATTDQAQSWFTENSAGSGPYVLESYKEGDSVVFVRNENYWGPSPMPAIKRVIMRHVVDASTQLQLLESGEADVAMNLDPDTAAHATSDQVTIDFVPTFNFLYIALLTGSEGVKGSDVDLKNKDVRQAIQAGIDYQGMVDTLVAGHGRTQASPIPNGVLGSENLAQPQHDVAKAKELLAKAGYPDGFELDAPYPNTNAYGVDFNLMMQKLQANLADIGVKLNLQPEEFAVWGAALQGHKIPLTALYWAPDDPDPYQYPGNFAMVKPSRWATRIGGKDGKLFDQAAQDLYDQGLATADTAKRQAIYEQLGKMMIDDAYIFPLVNPDAVLASRSDLVGMHYSGAYVLEIAELYRVKK